MQTLQQTYTAPRVNLNQRLSVISRFFNWAKAEDRNRYGWLAVILTVHGCVLSPITVLLIAMGGNSMALWGMAIGAMGMCLVTNLAAMPTKVTIPTFFLSVLIDVVVIGVSLNMIFA